MPATNDPQHLQLILWAVLALAGILLAVLGWALKGTLGEIKDGIVNLASDLRNLAATVGTHASSLAQGNVKFEELARRVNGLEDRERKRCNECRFDGSSPGSM